MKLLEKHIKNSNMEGSGKTSQQYALSTVLSGGNISGKGGHFSAESAVPFTAYIC
jgi:hypothetical protein